MVRQQIAFPEKGLVEGSLKVISSRPAGVRAAGCLPMHTLRVYKHFARKQVIEVHLVASSHHGATIFCLDATKKGFVTGRWPSRPRNQPFDASDNYGDAASG